MQFEIHYKPAHTLAVVNLAAGESVRAEARAMVSMTRNIQVQTQGPLAGQGGIFKGLKRAVFGGESFFTNTFTAMGGPGHVSVAPTLCGDMVVHELGLGQALYIQGSSYVAAPDSVTLDTRWQGMKGLFSGESLFFLEAVGSGPVLINAFGAIDVIELDGEVVIDTGHLVAFESGIQYTVDKAADGWISSFLSGEGLVLRMRGRGRVYVQSRNPAEYGQDVGRRLPARRG